MFLLLSWASHVHDFIVDFIWDSKTKVELGMSLYQTITFLVAAQVEVFVSSSPLHQLKTRMQTQSLPVKTNILKGLWKFFESSE